MLGNVVRPATTFDLPTLQAIERAAGEAFRELGMDAVADDDPPSIPQLQQFVDAERAWVIDRHDQVAAYLLASVIDGCGHVEQVSVHPDHAHQRLGAALVEHLADWARRRGLPALTLTTFCRVAWNGPYYLQRGFRWLHSSEITPGLQSLRDQEAAHGLDRWPRGCMRRDLAY